jgi:hypothetical protein
MHKKEWVSHGFKVIKERRGPWAYAVWEKTAYGGALNRGPKQNAPQQAVRQVCQASMLWPRIGNQCTGRRELRTTYSLQHSVLQLCTCMLSC